LFVHLFVHNAPTETTMLRTVFAVTLCLLALQCYSAAALAPHLECEPFWDAITYCSGDSAVALWERRWCERCCEGLSAEDTGFASDIFTDGAASPNSVVSDSHALALAMRRASALVRGSDLQPLNRAHYIASGSSGASYEPTSDGQTFGPSTCRTSGSTVTGTQTCCSGLAKVNGFCEAVKRSSDSEVEVKKQTSSLVTGYERCHHHWSLTGPASYEGNCFIRRLSTHLPTNYKVNNVGGQANCSGEPVAVNDTLTFGSAVPSRVDMDGFVNIDKCQSNMNWCHCCSKKKLSPLFGSFEYAAGPGLDMDAFDGLDSGSDDESFGPSTCRTSGATVTGTQTCCSGLAKVNGICTAV
jgi:hypothetical protein